MGGDVASIACDTLSEKLQSFLRDPIPITPFSETENRDISLEVNTLIQGGESRVTISSDDPIFRSSDSRSRDPDFVTQMEHEFTIGGKNVKRIFIMIDYSNFENTFKDIDEAQEHMNTWSGAICGGLQKLTKFAPEIIVHVLNSNDNFPVDPLEIYNNNYHSHQKTYPRFTNKEIPSIIIDCGSLNRHISCRYDGGISGRPDFHLVYSLLDSDDSNATSDIIDAVKEVGSGFAILHETTPGMDVVCNILKLGCILAVKYTIGTTDSSLIESFLAESFQSSREISTSKSGAIMTNLPYQGVPVIGTIEQFSDDWRPEGATEFYTQIKKFDAIIQNNLYYEESKLRPLLESRQKRWANFGFKYHPWNVISKKIKTIDEEIKFLKKEGKETDDEEKKKSLLESEFQKYKAIDVKEKPLILVQLWKDKIVEQIQSETEPIQLNQLLDYKSSQIMCPPKHAAVLFNALGTLVDGQRELYRSACPLHHSKIDDAPKLYTLYEHGVRFNLIDQIKMYPHLQRFLSVLKNMINFIYNNHNAGAQISDWIQQFYNLSQRVSQGDEEE